MSAEGKCKLNTLPIQLCDMESLLELYIFTEFNKLFVLMAAYLILLPCLCKILFQKRTSFDRAITSTFIPLHFIAQDRNFSTCYQKYHSLDHCKICLWLTVAPYNNNFYVDSYNK